jgi:hypothetical protein
MLAPNTIGTRQPTGLPDRDMRPEDPASAGTDQTSAIVSALVFQIYASYIRRGSAARCKPGGSRGLVGVSSEYKTRHIPVPQQSNIAVGLAGYATRMALA